MEGQVRSLVRTSSAKKGSRVSATRPQSLAEFRASARDVRPIADLRRDDELFLFTIEGLHANARS